MNWRQNKFLIGFGVVMLAGCGTLGFLTWQASSQFSDLSDEFSKQVAALNGLQNQPLYPEESNLDKLEHQKDGAIKAASAFQAQVTPMAFPLDPISPEQFQDKLRASVTAITAKADSAGVKLPAKFYLGFDEYQVKLPTTDAAPALNRELKAVELAISNLIDSKVVEIKSMKRDPLPEETDDTKARPGKQAVNGKSSALVSKFPFEIQFTSDQPAFRRALNALASNPQQLFVVRPLQIKNSVDKQISRETSPTVVAGATPAAAPSPASKSSEKNKKLKLLVGGENLSVSLRLEMVVFANTVAK